MAVQQDELMRVWQAACAVELHELARDGPSAPVDAEARSLGVDRLARDLAQALPSELRDDPLSSSVVYVDARAPSAAARRLTDSE